MENFKIYLENVAYIPDLYIPFYIHLVKGAYNFLKLSSDTQFSKATQSQPKTNRNARKVVFSQITQIIAEINKLF
ncbi:hypothetical protein ACX8XO_04190 [Calditrichota bacterium LG24]